MAVKRTPEQEAAVKNRGGALLVSAAAGSGKTRVLVERLLDFIINEDRDVDSFLIITFTRAAAEELRARIAKELSDAIQENPKNLHLRRQLPLLYKTQISTIHAFCTVLLRQWGHLLDVPSDFVLCEDEEASVMMHRALDDVLEQRYESMTAESEFGRFLDLLSAGRDDARLVAITLEVYQKIQSYADPIAWLEEQRRLLDVSSVADAGETPWGALLLEEAVQTADYCLRQMRRAVSLIEEDTGLLKAYGESYVATCEDLEAFLEAAKLGWDKAVASRVRFPKVKGIRHTERPDLQELVKNIRARCKKAIEEQEENLSGDSASLLADMALVYPAMLGLIDLVEDFSAAYAEEKKRHSFLDFSDLEHFTVRLLADSAGNPTELAKTWGSQYTEIMVDEYQDTNQVQNTIFNALSREGKNLFMVGDVKQSIYRFRLADPTIFLDKYHRFRPWQEAETGEERKVIMSQNFRSGLEVIETVNDVFGSIMSQNLGEMDYTEEAALRAPISKEQDRQYHTEYQTEYHFLDFENDPARTEEKLDKNLLEARFVARRIRALVDAEHLIDDGNGGKRVIQEDDVAILLRSPGPVQPYYITALEDEGLGWTAETGTDFFHTTELSVVISWLQIIDNPRQDIPLLAALRSPACGFTADRLAEIRSLCEGDYYDALVEAGRQGWADCVAFLNELEALRVGVGENTSHQIIWSLYTKTGLLEIFSSMHGGEKRRDNLLAFYEVARRFEASGHKGLFSFLLHLKRVQESGDLRVAPGMPTQSGGIKIMSIHRSKGLEFPIVFVCGLGRRFNYADLQTPVLFHTKLGLGAKGLDGESMVEFTTLNRKGVALALKKEMLAEEMRLLYVALTRAKSKIIMIHASVQGKKDLETLRDQLSDPLDPRMLASCSCVGQWLLMVALTREEGLELRKAAGMEPYDYIHKDRGHKWWIQPFRGAITMEPEGEPKQHALEGGFAYPMEKIVKELQWCYPYKTATKTPSKITATKVLRLDEEADSAVSLLREYDKSEKPLYRPLFAQESLGLTPAQEGTALHTVMQNIAMQSASSVAAVRAELVRMTEMGYLTKQQAESVDPVAVTLFFSSELGKRVQASETVSREFPFSVLSEARRFYPEAPEGEEILLQGVIDCWFEEEDGITVIDFKSDRVSPQQLEERAEEYRGQLATYAYALREMTGKPVQRQILYFLRSHTEIDLAPSKE